MLSRPFIYRFHLYLNFELINLAISSTSVKSLLKVVFHVVTLSSVFSLNSETIYWWQVADVPRLQRFTDDRSLMFHDYSGLLMTGRWCSTITTVYWWQVADVPRLQRFTDDRSLMCCHLFSRSTLKIHMFIYYKYLFRNVVRYLQMLIYIQM
jgi:hypothetical protein